MTYGATRTEVARPLRLCLSGAAPDTGNLGVEALYRSIVAGVARSVPLERLSVLDNGWGLREVPHEYGSFQLEHCGVRLSRRWHRPESWANIRGRAMMGGLGNPVAERLLGADGVLDISGGDSFSDIYGLQRFRAMAAPKKAAIALRRPLVLLPQTYGPFSDPALRAVAVRLVRSAAVAYSRDHASHEALLSLLGPEVDPSRHRLGVDAAFALVPRPPGSEMSADMRGYLTEPNPPRPRVGVNVSGLLYNDPSAADRFGLTLVYRSVVHDLIRWFADQGCDVLLVPHVRAPGRVRRRMTDDDVHACAQIEADLGSVARERVRTVPWGLRADEVKWIIAKMDWFCGTRMHATIASLSSGVPTAAIAYSMKTQGVFDACKQGGEVIDARQVGSVECLRRLQDAFLRRDEVRYMLWSGVEPVRREAADQLALAVRTLAGQAEERLR